jgi:hypothetical protein
LEHEKNKFCLDPHRYAVPSQRLSTANSLMAQGLLELQRSCASYRQQSGACRALHELAIYMDFFCDICERLIVPAGEEPVALIKVRVSGAHADCRREAAQYKRDQPASDLPRAQADPVSQERVDALLLLAEKTGNYLFEQACRSNGVTSSVRCLSKLTAVLQRQRRHLLKVEAQEPQI